MANFVKFSGTSKFVPDPKPEKVVKAKPMFSVKKRKPTGEAEIFRRIWLERGPYSQISGIYLGEYNVCFFAHIIPKGQNKYPNFKLREDNLCLMSLSEHTAWDGYRSKCNGKEWCWLLDKEVELKAIYKEMFPSK